MKTADYIDLLKKNNSWSDAEIGRRLNKSKQAVSSWRHNNVEMDDDTCILVAHALNIGPLKVLADIHAARSKSKTARKVWEQIASSAAGVILFLLAPLFLTYSPVFSRFFSNLSAQVSILC